MTHVTTYAGTCQCFSTDIERAGRMTVSPFCLARYPVKCQVEVQILMSMENGVNIGLFLHRLSKIHSVQKMPVFFTVFGYLRNHYLPLTQLTIILSLPQASLNSPGSRTQFREWSTYAKSSAYKRKVTVLVSPGRSSTFV